LIAGMCCAECRMSFELSIDSENDWEWSQVDMEAKMRNFEIFPIFSFSNFNSPSSVEDLRD
jgi:hypothetical protein